MIRSRDPTDGDPKRSKKRAKLPNRSGYDDEDDDDFVPTSLGSESDDREDVDYYPSLRDDVESFSSSNSLDVENRDLAFNPATKDNDSDNLLKRHRVVVSTHFQKRYKMYASHVFMSIVPSVNCPFGSTVRCYIFDADSSKNYGYDIVKAIHDSIDSKFSRNEGKGPVYEDHKILLKGFFKMVFLDHHYYDRAPEDEIFWKEWLMLSNNYFGKELELQDLGKWGEIDVQELHRLGNVCISLIECPRWD
jgi:hypothetical protein